MKATALPTVPDGWLLCDGAAVSRTTYAALFAAIGTAYGTGDGSTTFNLPNLKGRVPVGQDPAQTEFDTRGETGGAKTHTLTTGELPAHAHAITHGISPGSGSSNGLSRALTLSGLTTDTTYSSNAGSGTAHNNLQPYQVVNWLIKT